MKHALIISWHTTSILGDNRFKTLITLVCTLNSLTGACELMIRNVCRACTLIYLCMFYYQYMDMYKYESTYLNYTYNVIV